MNGEEAITSGDLFPKNTVLTVVATPAEGYILTNLYAGVTNITEAKSFTVGTKAIEVSAVFATRPTAIDNMADGEKAVKIVRNGVIYILRGEKLYNLQGQLVR